MKKIVFTLTLFLLSTMAHAENWVIITQSSKTGITQYVDIDSIERNLGLVELWRIVEYKAPSLREVNKKPYTSQKIRTEFDCPSRAMHQVSYTWYAGSMASGEVLKEMTLADDWLIDQFDEFTLPLWKMACSDWEEK
ncbi:MAG: hypothetical protein LW714_07970 [Oxalobacteraceae bacterium]|nr:hypothetical protein [Oxalobacteraceae bacterium]